LALDIIRGVHFLHSQSVTHRDIKSKNILLTAEGRAKISDVGLATILDDVSSSECFVGTFAWAAPEMLLGSFSTEKADIYSVGVVLWELATQEVPLRGCLRPPIVPEECPAELVRIIDACMAADPKDRPSAKNLYAMLLACPTTSDGSVAVGTASLVSSLPGSSEGSTALKAPSPIGSVAPPPNAGGKENGLAPWVPDPKRGHTEGMSSGGSTLRSLAGAFGKAVNPALRRVMRQIQKRMDPGRPEAAGKTAAAKQESGRVAAAV
jgi:serine/threonine protein kinase